MHDPLVVAHELVLPIPRRKWRAKGPRWSFSRQRRTNKENLGEPVYRWWRPKGYELVVAGWYVGLYRLATIWHREPGDRDSGEVCKHWADGKPRRAWKWHVHHWRVQVHLLQGTRARRFDRCALCGRKGRPNVSHQWNGAGVGWRKWRSRPGLFHSECSSLVQFRRTSVEDAQLIRWLVAGLAVEMDRPQAELVDRLTGSHVPDSTMPFHARYRLTRMLGYERDDNYQLVSACTGEERCRSQVHDHGCFADTDDAACRSPEEHQPRTVKTHA